jgi:hypothetical protein
VDAFAIKLYCFKALIARSLGFTKIKLNFIVNKAIRVLQKVLGVS